MGRNVVNRQALRPKLHEIVNFFLELFLGGDGLTDLIFEELPEAFANAVEGDAEGVGSHAEFLGGFESFLLGLISFEKDVAENGE